MYRYHKIVVVMPAYNAAKTLQKTYDTGYRAFSRELLESLALDGNSDDDLFDNQMLAQIIWRGCTIAEVSCPTKLQKSTQYV